MIPKQLASAVVVAIAVLAAAPAATQVAMPPPASGYAWADSCRTCHEDIYNAWAKTKHANALERLAPSDQEKACVGCHVTGSKERLFDGKKVINRGVQCEACHGAAGAHTAGTSRTGLVRKPPSSVCEECHSDKSPRFKGFLYDAMVGLSHKVQ